MTITTDHTSSAFGHPVILDDKGKPVDYAPGLKLLRGKLGLTQSQLATACGVSVRSVQNWEQGERMVDTAALNVMIGLLGGKVGV